MNDTKQGDACSDLLTVIVHDVPQSFQARAWIIGLSRLEIRDSRLFQSFLFLPPKSLRCGHGRKTNYTHITTASVCDIRSGHPCLTTDGRAGVLRACRHVSG